MTILSIESSCDETAAAILEVTGPRFRVRAHIVASQIPLHRQYGGVVPEVAARRHVEVILPVIHEALKKAGVTRKDISAIAAVNGPGLNMALIVGLETAKTLAYAWGKPLIPVNHIKAHMLANFISGEEGKLNPIKFPALCLVVSGGHTSLALLKSPSNIKIVGSTVDDAVGEAFDKVAKMLDLGYPGGPAISKRAINGDATAIVFPRPMLKSNNLNFSFAGIKTAVRYFLEKNKSKIKNPGFVDDVCASFQQACIDVLVSKTIAAAKKYKVKSVLLGGGVSANRELRRQMREAVEKLTRDQEIKRSRKQEIKYFEPDIAMTTDNALMSAVAGYFEAKRFGLKKFKHTWRTVKPQVVLKI